jgi:hypothetical protein
VGITFSTPLEENMDIDDVYKGVRVLFIRCYETRIDVMPLNLDDFDLILGVACVWHCIDHPHGSKLSRMMWVERIMNSYPLSIKKKNMSHHLVFWSLGTLTNLRVWVRGLIV